MSEGAKEQQQNERVKERKLLGFIPPMCIGAHRSAVMHIVLLCITPACISEGGSPVGRTAKTQLLTIIVFKIIIS